MNQVGTEYMVDAVGCRPERLGDRAFLKAMCDRILRDLDLHAVGDGWWHQFPPPGGLTGLYLLTESHLACHTYPETGVATFNLYCCRDRRVWPWELRLREEFGATGVTVRAFDRPDRGRQPT